MRVCVCASVGNDGRMGCTSPPARSVAGNVGAGGTGDTNDEHHRRGNWPCKAWTFQVGAEQNGDPEALRWLYGWCLMCRPWGSDSFAGQLVCAWLGDQVMVARTRHETRGQKGVPPQSEQHSR